MIEVKAALFLVQVLAALVLIISLVMKFVAQVDKRRNEIVFNTSLLIVWLCIGILKGLDKSWGWLIAACIFVSIEAICLYQALRSGKKEEPEEKSLENDKQ